MRRLERQRDSKKVPKKYHGAALAKKCGQLFRDKRDGTALDSQYWKANTYWPEAKPRLIDEARGNCAYCEIPFAAGGYGDVEHFRPKSVYWWLAYCYDNYAFSCQLCNQKFKSDAFPLEDEGRRLELEMRGDETDEEIEELVERWVPDPVTEAAALSWAGWAKAMAAEGALLPHPYLDEAEEYFVWEADADEKFVWIRAAGTTAKAQKRWETVDKVLGLNRDDLKRLRWSNYKMLEIVARSVQAPGLPADLQKDAKAALVAYWEGEQPFSGMARFYLRRWNLLGLLGVAG